MAILQQIFTFHFDKILHQKNADFLLYYFEHHRNLAKYFCGWSPLEQNHKIDEKNNTIKWVTQVMTFWFYCFMVQMNKSFMDLGMRFVCPISEETKSA
jgi:hypothetical protein